jgi:uncharacterized RDD family membrane protein YckC
LNDAELSLVPLEARPYQGAAAGIVTRVAANTVDALVVVLALAGTYAGIVAVTFVLDPRGFQLPDPSFLVFVIGYLDLLVVYLTAAWWVSGRTLGDHLMGIRVVTGQRSRLRILQAFARALLCAFFPVGLVWCAVDRDRRALHDLLLRTSVVYDWLPRPAARGGAGAVPEVGAEPQTAPSP